MSHKPGVTVNYYDSDYQSGARRVAWPKRRQWKKSMKQANLLYHPLPSILLLIKLSHVGTTNICRFYNTRRGCHKDNCQFLHIEQEELNQRVRNYTPIVHHINWTDTTSLQTILTCMDNIIHFQLHYSQTVINRLFLSLFATYI